MGKKRRLNSAKGKFRVKHNTHPRVRYLNAQEEVVEEVVVAVSPEPEVVLQEEVVEKIVLAAAPKPEVVLQQEEKVEETPKAAPKRKRTKKAPTKRRRAKKTVIQDVTT